MRCSTIAGLCLSACLASPAAAESWYRIATSDISVDYADADTLRSFGDVVSVDVFRGFELATEDGETAYLKLALDVSCASNQFRITRGVAYDIQRQYLKTDDIATPWEAISADSIAEQIRGFTCDSALRDEPVPNPFDDADAYWYSYGS